MKSFPAAVALFTGIALAVGAIAAPKKPARAQTATPESTSADAHYAVTQVLPSSDDGHPWNSGVALDREGKFLYILGGQHLLILDAATAKAVAKIDTCWSTGLAFVPEVNRGFLCTGQWGLIVFNLKTHAELGRVSLGGSALGSALYDPASNRVLVMKAPSAIVPINPAIDLKNAKLGKDIIFQGVPRAMVADGKGMVYVTVTGNDDIHEHVAVLDTRTMTIAATWLIPHRVNQASGISMDREHSRLFIACAGKLLIMSATDGHAIAILPVGNVSGGWVGSGTTAFYGGKIFASCGDRTFNIIGHKPDGRFALEQTLPDVTGVTAMAINQQTGGVYVPTPDEQKKHSPDGFKILVVEKTK